MKSSMKYIQKRQPPAQWTEFNDPNAWIDQDGNPMNWTYEHDIGHDLREILKRSLVDEQGGICGYTGLRISVEESHVEHIKPQNRCVNHEDVDYNNLIAAYPAGGCEFGARAKDGWYEENEFISPLHPNCEQAFLYYPDGDIAPRDPANNVAIRTINVLNLKCPAIKKMREGAIEALFERELTRQDVETFILILDQRQEDTGFIPLCFVIKNILQSYMV